MKARLYKKKLGMVAENEMLAKRATFRVCRENFLNHALSNIGKCIFRRTFTIKFKKRIVVDDMLPKETFKC